jgi:hypothetical protein
MVWERAVGCTAPPWRGAETALDSGASAHAMLKTANGILSRASNIAIMASACPARFPRTSQAKYDEIERRVADYFLPASRSAIMPWLLHGL